MKVKVGQLCPTLCDPGQNTGMGSLSLLQGIFPPQGSNPGLLHCRQILYQLSHQRSPRILEWVAYLFSIGSFQPRDPTRVFCIAGRFFTSWATRGAQYWAFQVVLMVKNPPANAGDARDMVLIPESERSPRVGNGHPLQYSWLGNPIDRGAWRATVHGIAKSRTQLSKTTTIILYIYMYIHTHIHTYMITTIHLVNIHHLTFFSHDENF